MSFSAMKINVSTIYDKDLVKKYDYDSSDITEYVRNTTNGTIVHVENIENSMLNQIVIVDDEQGDTFFDVDTYAYVSWHHGTDPVLVEVIAAVYNYMNSKYTPDWKYGKLAKRAD